ncbi:hypothetical protein L228DRAFT_271498 [Xylona heveae TC161]|uniref:DUF7730 domain-containing protein n=1 Tax=Xylona heveae (strain CBS 132557 / TC161) TaxID=1328760 RepID=A0A164ZLP9_XYLHT|nr:hypothetical protein L228DRAFT_271498 [Xylona heveae TC161]KZF19253.1 hypothetical protein L228DRAFT_271498 [Xylona heveae TC161]
MPFPFLKLPAELRNEIYHYHLLASEKIKPTLPDDTSFVRTHLARCPLNSHMVRGRIKCTDCFSGNEEIIRIPPSSLSLLLVNKQIYNEALSIFYHENHFVFANTGELGNFLKAIGPKRRKFISKLTFGFGWGAHQAFKLLAESLFLKELHINMDLNQRHLGVHHKYFVPSMMRLATGMPALSKLRGLEIVELTGQDKTARGIVDVNDEGAVGPWLKEQLLQPREEKRTRRSRARKSALPRQHEFAEIEVFSTYLDA